MERDAGGGAGGALSPPLGPGAGPARARRRGRRLRGAAPHLPRAQPAGQPHGARPAPAGSRPRVAGRDLPRALARHAGLDAGGAEGGRRGGGPRSGLSGGPPGLHHPRRPAAGADHPGVAAPAFPRPGDDRPLPGGGGRAVPRGGRGEPGERRRAGQPDLCHLHLGLDGHAQGHPGLPPGVLQPACLAALALAPGRRRTNGAVRHLRLLRLLPGDLLVVVLGRGAGAGERAGAAGRREARRVPGGRGGRTTLPAVRGAEASRRGGRGAGPAALSPAGGDHRGRAAPGQPHGARPLRASPRLLAAQPVRRLRDARGDRPHPYRQPGGMACHPIDRAADRQRADPPARRLPRAGADRRAGRALCRRGLRAAGVSQRPAADGAEDGAGSLLRGARDAALPHRRLGPPSRRRAHRVPRPHRHPGQDPRLPRRAGGDRHGAGQPSGGPRRGGRGADGEGRQAPGGLRGARAAGGDDGRRAAWFPEAEAARVHGAGRLRDPRHSAAQRQWQARPGGPAGPRPRPAGAGGDGGAAHRGRGDAGGDLGRGAGAGAGRRARQLLRAGGALAARHPGRLPGPGRLRRRAADPPAVRVAHRGGAGGGARAGPRPSDGAGGRSPRRGGARAAAGAGAAAGRAAALFRPGAALVPRPPAAERRSLQHTVGGAPAGRSRRRGVRRRDRRDRAPARSAADGLRRGA